MKSLNLEECNLKTISFEETIKINGGESDAYNFGYWCGKTVTDTAQSIITAVAFVATFML